MQMLLLVVMWKGIKLETRERQGRDAGARSANRQDKIEQKRNQSRKVWRKKLFAWEGAGEEQPKVVSLGDKEREIHVHTAVSWQRGKKNTGNLC